MKFYNKKTRRSYLWQWNNHAPSLCAYNLMFLACTLKDVPKHMSVLENVYVHSKLSVDISKAKVMLMKTFNKGN